MDDKVVTEKRRRWSIRKEKKRQELVLRDKPASDEIYEPTLAAVERMEKIRNARIDTVMNVLKVVGGLAVMMFVAGKANEIDKSDAIPRNKQSGRLADRIMPKLW